MKKKFNNQFVTKMKLANCNCDFPVVKFSTEFPDMFDPGVIYIRGERKSLYTIGFMCPCNKSHKVFLNMQKDEHPYWRVKFHINRTITIMPSIWFKTECMSHYYIVKGNVINVELSDF